MPDPQALLSGFASTPTPATPAPLATSREDIDPAQLGALVAQLAHATSKKPTPPSSSDALVPPQQSSPQPLLSPGAARLAAEPIAPPLAVSHAQVPVAHIGASQVGERYVPPSFGQIMTSDNPLQGVAEHVLGPSRPRSVQAADPYGEQAWAKGAGSVPLLMLGSTEALTGDAAQLAENAGRGLYSRVDDVASQIPEKGVHPNKVASLLKSGASQEEVAYRKVPEFLAGKGQGPVTRAELQAHLSANPAPFPEATTLGGANPARPTTLPPGYHIEPMEQSGFGRFTLVGPDGTGRVLYSDNPVDALGEALTKSYPNTPPTLPTKFQSYSLPGGENYREHLLQLPDPIGVQRADLQRQIDAKLAEIHSVVPADASTLTPEAYHASPQYARLKQIMDEHNALNDQLRALPPSAAGYTSGHFDQPNVLAHVRTTERTLPGAPPPVPPVPTEAEFAALLERHGIDNAASVAHSEYGDPRSEIWRNYLAEHGQGSPAPVPQLTGADLHQQGWTVRVDREEPYSGRRQMTLLNPQGEWSGSRGMTPLTPEEYLHDHALGLNRQAQDEAQTLAAQPTGPRGRFLEEVQSDWHQAGKRTGYQTPPTPEQQARLDQLPAEIDSAGRMVAGHRALRDEAGNAHLDRLISETRSRLPPEFAHLTSFSDALKGTDADVAAWRAARDTAAKHPEVQQLRAAELQADNRLADAQQRLSTLHDEQRAITTPKGVPNAPFKEGWPDLALKQQLLDVAGDPNSHWLGFTGGKTQAARYDLSKQVSRIHFEPEEPGDYSLGSLVAHDLNGNEVMRENRLEPHEFDDHIGKEPAEALRREIASAQHDAEQWSVGHNEADPTDKSWYVIDPNGEIVDERSSGGWNSHDMAERQRQEIISGRYYSDYDAAHPQISGLDLQVGGEGMHSFYDQLLPARLRKLVKPFGGTVEPVDLPAGKEGFRILNQHGEVMGRYDSLHNAQADLPNLQRGLRSYQLSIAPPAGERSWITHLSPEMKREILRKGFPLLTLPLGAAASSLASRPGAQVGTPPPVEREPPPQR